MIKKENQIRILHEEAYLEYLGPAEILRGNQVMLDIDLSGQINVRIDVHIKYREVNGFGRLQ